MGIRINRNLCIVVSLAGILSASAMLLAQTKPAAPDAPPPELQTFAIIYQPGPNWIAGKSIFEQDLMEHGQYMASTWPSCWTRERSSWAGRFPTAPAGWQSSR
jgi:hypothetical protein